MSQSIGRDGDRWRRHSGADQRQQASGSARSTGVGQGKRSGAFDVEQRQRARRADRVTGTDQPDAALRSTPTFNWCLPAALMVVAVAIVAALAMLR